MTALTACGANARVVAQLRAHVDVGRRSTTAAHRAVRPPDAVAWFARASTRREAKQNRRSREATIRMPVELAAVDQLRHGTGVDAEDGRGSPPRHGLAVVGPERSRTGSAKR
jgi:hypothetical protein